MATTTDYDQQVAALFARQPTRMVPDLDRIRTLTELLGRPDQAYPAIQITGTNGKTSTAHMLTALLSGLGLTAGTYTSPHLQDVRERIRIAGEPIEREAVTAGLAYLEPFLAEVDSRHPDPVTFFEVLTALAFTHFADQPVDVAVVEVGMGGTWDATNLVRGEVAVIGTVSLDHRELGASVGEVAEEKAGIIKDGAIVVSAPQAPEAAAVIARVAAERGARLVLAGEDYDVASTSLAVGGQHVDLRGVTGDVEGIYLPLHGAHQARNAAVALAALEGFLGFAGGLDADLVREAFAAVRSPGRLEVIRRPQASTVVLDGAHNPAGMRALADALTDEFGFRNRVAVVGILGDKDIPSMLAAVGDLADHVVVTEPPSPRAAPALHLAAQLETLSLSVEVAPDVGTALERASGVAVEGDGVIVTGSLHTVGAARDALGLEPA